MQKQGIVFEHEGEETVWIGWLRRKLQTVASLERVGGIKTWVLLSVIRAKWKVLANTNRSRITALVSTPKVSVRKFQFCVIGYIHNTAAARGSFCWRYLRLPFFKAVVPQVTGVSNDNPTVWKHSHCS